MTDNQTQAASTGKVLWHVTMSLDGFIAGPNHSMDWMSGLSFSPGLVDKYAASTGAILAGRRWHDAFAGIPEAAPCSTPRSSRSCSGSAAATTRWQR